MTTVIVKRITMHTEKDGHPVLLNQTTPRAVLPAVIREVLQAVIQAVPPTVTAVGG